jgi:ABC-2 type transport system ATP-binding protein
MSVISALGVVKSLGKKRIIEIGGLSIEKGELIGLVGGNGSGKTTLYKLLTGVLFPDEGTIQIFGFDSRRLKSSTKRKIGAFFCQRYQIQNDLPVIESFRLYRAIYGLGNSEYKTTLDTLSQELKLDRLLEKTAKLLSSGERMRCEIALTVMHRPELLFLDEPTNGLDIESKALLRHFIMGYRAARQATVMITSHETAEILELCERTIGLEQGRIAFDVGLEAIRSIRDHKTIDVEFVEKDKYQKDDCPRLSKARLDGDPLEVQEALSSILSEKEVRKITMHPLDLGSVFPTLKKIYAKKE